MVINLDSTNVRIPDYLHNVMKELAGSKRGAINKEYLEAIKNHIALKKQEELKRHSNIIDDISNRIEKAENHLASMLGRTGMDTSIVLMGIVELLEKLYAGNKSRVDIQNELRKLGALYYTKKGD